MRTRIGLLGASLLTLTLAACGGGQAGGSGAAGGTGNAGNAGNGDKAAAAPQRAGTTVKITLSGFGPILTDQAGRTLYAFTKDKDGTSQCADECIATWPALTSAAPVAAGAGTERSLLGTTARAEGSTQATYGAWPLYYYAGDTESGDVNGQGVDGVWFVLSADGRLIRTAA